jgi:threonine/homoserine/homoserine lactone efflux protein
MVIAILFTVYLASAVIGHFLARHRGANAVFRGVMGAIFGPLAIPFVFMARTSDKG